MDGWMGASSCSEMEKYWLVLFRFGNMDGEACLHFAILLGDSRSRPIQFDLDLSFLASDRNVDLVVWTSYHIFKLFKHRGDRLQDTMKDLSSLTTHESLSSRYSVVH